MKKNIILFSAILTLAILVPSCDVVEEPYLKPVGSNDPNPTEKIRKVFLEDYTGHKCPNCPEAADEAAKLKALYGEQLVVMAIHTGFYSTPSAEFPADYRTTTGDELNAYFNIQGYPSGLINRTEYKGNLVQFVNSWEGAVADQVALPAQADIQITNDYNPGTRKLTCSLSTEFLENLSGTFNICVFITESGIVSPQQSGSGIIEDYEHNHVLRAAVFGTWGSAVGTTGQAMIGAPVTNEFTYTLPVEWNADHCEVVAFVYNTDSREIVQAAEKKIIE